MAEGGNGSKERGQQPPADEATTITLTVPNVVLEMFKILARVSNCSTSALMERALFEHVAGHGAAVKAEARRRGLKA